jgi:hypothetical protein
MNHKYLICFLITIVYIKNRAALYERLYWLINNLSVWCSCHNLGIGKFFKFEVSFEFCANSTALISYNAGSSQVFLGFNISLGTDSFVVSIQILCGFHKPSSNSPFNAAVIMACIFQFHSASYSVRSASPTCVD